MGGAVAGFRSVLSVSMTSLQEDSEVDAWCPNLEQFFRSCLRGVKHGKDFDDVPKFSGGANLYMLDVWELNLKD